MKPPKAIAIVGPTASGKTSLSIRIAKKVQGEVISADSRQVYRGMDLGTGKVTKEEMDDIPHHLLDIADPMEVYTGSRFVVDAAAALSRIERRCRVPIVAGGTFFYVDLLRGKLATAPVAPDQTLRHKLEALSTEELFDLLETKDARRAAAIDPHNRRRLIRALEIIDTLGLVPPTPQTSSTYQWLILGIKISQADLHHNIYKRIIDRIDQGMIEEVERLHFEGVSYERMEALGLEYRYISRYLQGELSLPEMIETLNTKTKQFAKQQLTWLKKDPDIKWIDPSDDANVLTLVETFLHQ